MSSSMAMMKTLHVTCEIALQLKIEIKTTNTKSTPKGPIGIRFAEFLLTQMEFCPNKNIVYYSCLPFHHMF